MLNRRRAEGPFVDTDLDTLATALYVTCDDLLVIRPEHAPYRPESGFEPAITAAELITLAVMSALLGYTSERRWLRYAHQNLRAMFPALPRPVRLQQATPQTGPYHRVADRRPRRRH